MRHLVIGLGEVGTALRNVLQCEGLDPTKGIAPLHHKFDVLHICFPYSPNFDADVRKYGVYYLEPQGENLIVIHSTVPVGTSTHLGVHHSPVRGKHPNLATSLKVFKKYVAGPQAHDVCREFKKYGIPAVPVEKPENTEAGKLIDLMQYGMSILLEKEIYAYCEKNGLDFEVVYTHFNETYNKGYSFMDSPQFVRPVLEHTPGKIGGHCVVPMMQLLDCPSAKRIIGINENL